MYVLQVTARYLQDNRESSGIFGFGQKRTTTISRNIQVTNYFWDFSIAYEINAYVGSNPDDKAYTASKALTN